MIRVGLTFFVVNLCQRFRATLQLCINSVLDLVSKQFLKRQGHVLGLRSTHIFREFDIKSWAQFHTEWCYVRAIWFVASQFLSDVMLFLPQFYWFVYLMISCCLCSRFDLVLKAAHCINEWGSLVDFRVCFLFNVCIYLMWYLTSIVVINHVT